MKNNLIFFMIFLLSLLLFFAHTGEANIPCSTVMMKAAPCVTFATGKATTPAVACCSGLQQLAQSVKSVDDKKAVCRCLKGSAKNLGVQDRFLTQIPTACKIKLGFPVSTTTSCDTIQ